MKKLLLSFILISTLFGDIILVGNQTCKIENISNVELKNIYLGINRTLNNEKINIYDSKDIKLYEEFITEILKKSVVSLETYWVKMLFSGRAKPPQQISFSEFLELSNSKECNMSYIRAKEYKSSLKRIAIVE